MPIIKNKDKVYVEYDIPAEIDKKIPNYFYRAMEGELVSINGRDFWNYISYSSQDSDDIENSKEILYWDSQSTSAGWQAAFYMCCKKLNIMWLYEYYESLPWYDADVFNGVIEMRIYNKIYEQTELTPITNDYYKMIIAEIDARKEKLSQ